jgi:hypothetical protein
VKSIVPGVLLLSSLGAGCVHPSTNEVLYPDATAAEPPAEPYETRSLELTYDDPDDEASEPAVEASSAPLAPLAPDATLFHIGAGYGALGRIDLALCRDEGLQTGYLHLRATFRVDGRVVRAVVESRLGPPPDALACIGEQLKMAVVPVFSGGDVTLSRSFFVN